MSQNVLWQPSLQEEVLDLHAGHEAVLVAVCLLEERLVPQSVPGVDDPGHGLEVVDGSGRLRGNWLVGGQEKSDNNRKGDEDTIKIK